MRTCYRAPAADPSARAMALHVDELVAKHEIDVRPIDEELVAKYPGHLPRDYAQAIAPRGAARGAVELPAIESLLDYYSALHEIAHVAGSGPCRNGSVLELEAWTWAYALNIARYPPSPEVMDMISGSLRSYMRPRLRRPDAGHPFWVLLDGRRPGHEDES